MMLNSGSGYCTTYSAALYGKILEKCFDSLEPTLESAVAAYTAYSAAALSLSVQRNLSIRLPYGLKIFTDMFCGSRMGFLYRLRSSQEYCGDACSIVHSSSVIFCADGTYRFRMTSFNI